MAVTHTGVVGFIGDQGYEVLAKQTTIGSSFEDGYKLLHSTSSFVTGGVSVGSTINYEYAAQSGDGENWITVI